MTATLPAAPAAVTPEPTAAPAELGVHVDREDRARTNAGKTINSKVRSEGRAHAALERASLAQRSYLAQEARGVSRA